MRPHPRTRHRPPGRWRPTPAGGYRGDGVPLDAPIPCRRYWIFLPDPHIDARTGPRRLVYVGECVDTPSRGPRDRFEEHCERQPWGDTIPTHDYDQAVAAGIFVLDPVVYGSKREAKIAELASIVPDRPVYNWKGNELNRDVIPPSKQIAQRAERDRANGVPADRTWAALNAHRLARPAPWRNPILWWRRQRYRTRRRIIWSTIWANLTVTGWILGAVVLPIPASVTGATAAAASTWTVLRKNMPPRDRRYARAGNTIVRWLAVAVAVAVIASNLTPN